MKKIMILTLLSSTAIHSLNAAAAALESDESYTSSAQNQQSDQSRIRQALSSAKNAAIDFAAHIHGTFAKNGFAPGEEKQIQSKIAEHGGIDHPLGADLNHDFKYKVQDLNASKPTPPSRKNINDFKTTLKTIDPYKNNITITNSGTGQTVSITQEGKTSSTKGGYTNQTLKNTLAAIKNHQKQYPTPPTRFQKVKTFFKNLLPTKAAPKTKQITSTDKSASTDSVVDQKSAVTEKEQTAFNNELDALSKEQLITLRSSALPRVNALIAKIENNPALLKNEVNLTHLTSILQRTKIEALINRKINDLVERQYEQNSLNARNQIPGGNILDTATIKTLNAKIEAHNYNTTPITREDIEKIIKTAN